MAVPLLAIGAASGASWVAGKWDSWFGEDDEPKSTGASVWTVTLVALALFGAYMVYRYAKRGLK